MPKIRSTECHHLVNRLIPVRGRVPVTRPADLSRPPRRSTSRRVSLVTRVVPVTKASPDTKAVRDTRADPAAPDIPVDLEGSVPLAGTSCGCGFSLVSWR